MPDKPGYDQPLPYSIRHVFCMCKEFTYSTEHKRNKRPEKHRNFDGTVTVIRAVSNYFACKVCGGYPRYELRRCKFCAILYVRTAFEHPLLCIYEGACIDCLDKQTKKVCQERLSGASHAQCDTYTERIVWDEFALIPRDKSTLPPLSTTSILSELDLDF